MKMNPVTWFEIPAADMKRMSKFYSDAFGWKVAQEMKDPSGMEYNVVHTTETDKDGMIKKPGAINGGLYTKSDDKPDQHPSIVINVDDIKEAAAKITKAGGKVLGEPAMIPTVGWYVAFLDPEGNRSSLLQVVM